MMYNKALDIAIRYIAATFGLALVAVGVAFSIISDLGTAPISCPPYVASLWGGFTVGQYTAAMHMLFIVLQIAMLRCRFKAVSLLQVVAAVVFGGLTDAALWATSWIAPSGYAGKFALMIAGCVITATGISIEVRAKAWMLAGEMTVAAIAEISGARFRNIKIGFDCAFVIIAGVMSLCFFGDFLGKGETVVIREGTLASALLTGFLMRFIDPVTDKVFGKILDKYHTE